MQKILIFIFIGLLFGINSCEEDKDLFLYDGPNYVSFMESGNGVTAYEGEANEYSFEIGVTTSSSSQRTYAVEIDVDASSAIEGTHFTMDSKEFSVAADEYKSSLSLSAIFENLPAEGVDVVISLVNTADTADFSIMSYSLTITPYCPFVTADLAGEYTGTSGAHGDPVTVEAINDTQVRVYELGAFIQSSWGESWVTGDGSCVMDVSPDGSLSISIQQIGVTDYPDVYGIVGSGSYNACTGDISIDYQIYYGFDGSSGTLAANVSTVLSLNPAKNSIQIKAFDIKKYN